MSYNGCVMANVTIRRNGTEFEVTGLSFDQVKELVGVNEPIQANLPLRPVSAIAPMQLPMRSDFKGFLKTISDRGRVFISTLRQNPQGIEANALAFKLGYQDARQIGGLTGGGIAKIAKRHAIKIQDIYRAETTFPSGKRTVMFYPGVSVLAMIDEEKPA